MKKTLIAFGAALTCLGAAHAQSNVQLTGLVDMYAGSMKLAGEDRKSVVGSGGMSTSWWGVQGSEDLGGGLKAGFMLGAFFRGDTGSPGRYDLAFGETFFARDANVSLAGSFGKLTLGRTSAPNFLPSVFANPFGDSFTVSPLILHENMWTDYSRADLKALNTSPADTGWSNQILYSSPDFGGLSFNLAYQFGEVATANSKKNVGVNATYRTGGLMLTGFYERAQVQNPTGGLLASGTKQDWMLGGSYDFKVVKVYGTYGQAKTKDNDNYEGKTVSLGLDVPVSSAGTIKAAIARTKIETRVAGVLDLDGNRTTTTIGYDHNLSKRTDLYGVVMNDRLSGLKSGTSFAVGMRHRF
ncbi:porin [Comamonas sp. 17RB]|uniref:porin n=1 Tax=Comamonas sp. 17RB TaxID=3047025 RepID=UPI0024B6EE61|nr:porin [Comamonas sp. 17RB]MDI9855623.1 porin [Comamonas sp. 17RB]